MMPKKEVWMNYPLDYEVENDVRLEISNLGRAKSYNARNPEGRILKGSLQSGFPIIRLKLFRKRKPLEQEKLDELNGKIAQLNEEIKKLGTASRVALTKVQLRAERDSLVKQRMKYNAKVDLRRTINVAVLIHKAVAELFLEKPESTEQKFIIHKDFDKLNNNAENLAWASQQDLNQRVKDHPKMILHAFRKQFEEHVPNTKMGKLQENDVLYIKKRLKKGDTLRKLAQKFEVSDMQIHRIKTGENWGHVKLIEDILDEKRK